MCEGNQAKYFVRQDQSSADNDVMKGGMARGFWLLLPPLVGPPKTGGGFTNLWFGTNSESVRVGWSGGGGIRRRSRKHRKFGNPVLGAGVVRRNGRLRDRRYRKSWVCSKSQRWARARGTNGGAQACRTDGRGASPGPIP